MNYNTFINKDLRNRAQTRRHPRLRWFFLAAGCSVIGLVIASTSMPANNKKDLRQLSAESLQKETSTISETRRLELSPSHAPAAPSVQATNTPLKTLTLTVKKGSNLSNLFDKAGIRPSQLIALLHSGSDSKVLKRLHPGDKITVQINEAGELISLHYDINSTKYLQISRTDNQLTSSIQAYDIETRSAYAQATITSSLFWASQKAGLSQNLTMELANIFGWDIDFALDIRQGDSFTIIYEEIFKSGEKIKDGNIIAAEFINQGKTFRALRYVEPSSGKVGYYSPDGHSLRKAFLRSPVRFSRISSRFTNKRYHPLLHKFRSHKGVDYAASRGTPVRASGDGKVIWRGRKGGYGNAIILKHGSRYTTLYGHLSKFNRKVRSGSRVKQGQIIGYVGSTGLASGPHLHYEFRVNGVHRNPLTVKFPSTRPIPKRHRDDFKLSTQGYIAQLDLLSRTALALNQH